MHLVLERTIQRPVRDVFALFTDLRGAPGRVRGIHSLEVLTEGPVRAGTQFRETRILFKRPATETLTITALEPERRYVVGCHSCGCEYETEFRFQSVGEFTTHVAMELKARPVTFMARLLQPLGKLMAGSMRKLLNQDLDDLKAAAEQPARG